MNNELDGANQENSPRLASRLMAILTESAEDPPSVSRIIEHAQSSFTMADWAVLPLTRGASEIWKAQIIIRWPFAPPALDGEPARSLTFEERAYEIWLQKQSPLEDWHFEELELTQEEYAQTRNAFWSLGIGTMLEGSCVLDYHRLTKVAHALAPAAPAYMDVSSCMLKPGRWMSEAAKCPIPPSPRHLFSIHSVHSGGAGGSGGSGEGDTNGAAPGAGKSPEPVWLHTHGLLRCGSVEFEILGIPDPAFPQAVELLEAVCVHAIEEGVGPPRAPFSPGEGIVMEWLEWPDAVRRFRRLSGSRVKDRDDFHRLTSGVLVERASWPLWPRYRTPLHAFKALAHGATLYFSDSETRRMRQIAAFRYPLFREVFERRKHDLQWNFFAKFGYATDHAENESDREHLWFQCLKTEEARVFGLLVNEPLDIASMREGQSDWHDLSRLTDWRIQTPERLYDPDNIVLLDEIAEGLGRP